MTDSRVGVGEHIVEFTTNAASTVGQAAGLVIAAPVAVVDPNTRENYGRHMENLGNVAADAASSGRSVATTAPGQ